MFQCFGNLFNWQWKGTGRKFLFKDDHTRVQLLSCGGGPPKKGHDYVNANYIDGWQRTRAYIGTQGPLPPTFDGFWRMVWEQRVSIVVMITNLVERGRVSTSTILRTSNLYVFSYLTLSVFSCLQKKCDMYWPKKGSETYGYIQVTLLREDVMATYTIRTLQIRHMKVDIFIRSFIDKFFQDLNDVNVYRSRRRRMESTWENVSFGNIITPDGLIMVYQNIRCRFWASSGNLPMPILRMQDQSLFTAGRDRRTLLSTIL